MAGGSLGPAAPRPEDSSLPRWWPAGRPLLPALSSAPPARSPLCPAPGWPAPELHGPGVTAPGSAWETSCGLVRRGPGCSHGGGLRRAWAGHRAGGQSSCGVRALLGPGRGREGRQGCVPGAQMAPPRGAVPSPPGAPPAAGSHTHLGFRRPQAAARTLRKSSPPPPSAVARQVSRTPGEGQSQRLAPSLLSPPQARCGQALWSGPSLLLRSEWLLVEQTLFG